MFSSATVFAMRSMLDLMDSMRRREEALNQAFVLDASLGQQLQRLVGAFMDSRAAFQYSLGLHVLVLWDIKHLYEMSATRSAHAAHRASVRLAYMARRDMAGGLSTAGAATHVEREIRAHAQHGIDPEDLYIDETGDDSHEQAAEHSDLAENDDDVFDADDVTEGEVSPGKLSSFVEWDFMKRGE